MNKEKIANALALHSVAPCNQLTIQAVKLTTNEDVGR